MIYPHFIEAHGVSHKGDVVTSLFNIDNITIVYDDPDKIANSIVVSVGGGFYSVAETVDEIKQLLIDAGCNITKTDPRIDTSHPLSWNVLTSIEMIGEPVWNSNSRKWMLLIDSSNLNEWIDLINTAGGTERWIEHDTKKYPLYRMRQK